MKVCELCGEEIYTKDGENRCGACDALEAGEGLTEYGWHLKREAIRRERDLAMQDLGLVKVRGSMGGTYWE